MRPRNTLAQSTPLSIHSHTKRVGLVISARNSRRTLFLQGNKTLGVLVFPRSCGMLNFGLFDSPSLLPPPPVFALLLLLFLPSFFPFSLLSARKELTVALFLSFLPLFSVQSLSFPYSWQANFAKLCPHLSLFADFHGLHFRSPAHFGGSASAVDRELCFSRIHLRRLNPNPCSQTIFATPKELHFSST